MLPVGGPLNMEPAPPAPIPIEAITQGIPPVMAAL
jgi:hypothetical protein